MTGASVFTMASAATAATEPTAPKGSAWAALELTLCARDFMAQSDSTDPKECCTDVSPASTTAFRQLWDTSAPAPPSLMLGLWVSPVSTAFAPIPRIHRSTAAFCMSASHQPTWHLQ